MPSIGFANSCPRSTSSRSAFTSGSPCRSPDIAISTAVASPVCTPGNASGSQHMCTVESSTATRSAPFGQNTSVCHPSDNHSAWSSAGPCAAGCRSRSTYAPGSSRAPAVATPDAASTVHESTSGTGRRSRSSSSSCSWCSSCPGASKRRTTTTSPALGPPAPATFRLAADVASACTGDSVRLPASGAAAYSPAVTPSRRHTSPGASEISWVSTLPPARVAISYSPCGTSTSSFPTARATTWKVPSVTLNATPGIAADSMIRAVPSRSSAGPPARRSAVRPTPGAAPAPGLSEPDMAALADHLEQPLVRQVVAAAGVLVHDGVQAVGQRDHPLLRQSRGPLPDRAVPVVEQPHRAAHPGQVEHHRPPRHGRASAAEPQRCAEVLREPGLLLRGEPGGEITDPLPDVRLHRRGRDVAVTRAGTVEALDQRPAEEPTPPVGRDLLLDLLVRRTVVRRRVPGERLNLALRRRAPGEPERAGLGQVDPVAAEVAEDHQLGDDAALGVPVAALRDLEVLPEQPAARVRRQQGGVAAARRDPVPRHEQVQPRPGVVVRVVADRRTQPVVGVEQRADQVAAAGPRVPYLYDGTVRQRFDERDVLLRQPA